MFFPHDFVTLSVNTSIFKSVTVNLGAAEMEGPYILYKRVLLFIKIWPCYENFFFLQLFCHPNFNEGYNIRYKLVCVFSWVDLHWLTDVVTYNIQYSWPRLCYIRSQLLPVYITYTVWDPEIQNMLLPNLIQCLTHLCENIVCKYMLYKINFVSLLCLSRLVKCVPICLSVRCPCT